jgi:hypothetical protein
MLRFPIGNFRRNITRQAFLHREQSSQWQVIKTPLIMSKEAMIVGKS